MVREKGGLRTNVYPTVINSLYFGDMNGKNFRNDKT
jgi:hypothetical protein